MPKRYEDMTTEERIAVADKFFVSELEKSLRNPLKKSTKKSQLPDLIKDALRKYIMEQNKKLRSLEVKT